MKSIRQLSQETVNQISAGEVIERPAQIVKELVENAVDAGADEIEVEFDEGGRFLKVRDNGHGISRDQMSLALARYATSKIREFDDLWKLSTHGFRGEALAAISAVSELTLISQTQDSPAFRLQSRFGSIQDIQPTGSAQGTTVIVQSLFENTPARFKFLKSPAGESAAVKQVLRALALSHPRLSFRVLSRGQLVFYWPSKKSFMDRSRQVLGIEDLYYAEGERGAYRAKSVVSAPNNTVKSRRSSWFFVSNRWVECRVLQSALMSAYRGLLMHGEYPVAVVQVTGPGDEIDVNVHPAKSQVRFKNSSMIFKLVESSIRGALERAPWTKNISSGQKSSKEVNLQFADSGFAKTRFPGGGGKSVFPVKSLSSLSWKDPSELKRSSQDDGGETSSPSVESLSPDLSQGPDRKKQEEDLSSESFQDGNLPLSSESAQNRNPSLSSESFQDRKPWSSLQALAQVHLTYIVCQSRRSLVLIDQHAAHERFLYEALFRSFKEGNMEIQNHLVPVSLELEEDEREAVLSLEKNLLQLGVKLERLGPETLGVTASPALLKDQALKQGIFLLVRKFIETKDHFAFERVLSDLFATMACHSAIRAGQSLTQAQMDRLLKQMDEHPLSSFCPHGRPVFVEYSISRLEKDFGRRV